MSDPIIIQFIKAKGSQKEKAARYMLKSYVGFIDKVSTKTRLSHEETLVVYSDTVIDLIHQVSNDNFNSQSKLSTYFYSILYHKAVDYSRRKSTNLNIDYDTVPWQLIGISAR